MRDCHYSDVISDTISTEIEVVFKERKQPVKFYC